MLSLNLDPYRSPLKDTPTVSPVATACTSVEPTSDNEEDFLHHEHSQDIFSDGHTPSQWSVDSEANNEKDIQNDIFGQYRGFEDSNRYLPEGSYVGIDASGCTALSPSDPWHASSLVASRNRAYN